MWWPIWALIVIVFAIIDYSKCFLTKLLVLVLLWYWSPLTVLLLFRSSPAIQREALLELMWSVWPDLPVYGSKAAQFVDLLGYFTIKTPQSSEQKVSELNYVPTIVCQICSNVLTFHCYCKISPITLLICSCISHMLVWSVWVTPNSPKLGTPLN